MKMNTKGKCYSELHMFVFKCFFWHKVPGGFLLLDDALRNEECC